MKFGCSLEMVNMLTSGPCAFTRQSKKFWMDYFTYVAAVGFHAIELPFNCFTSDAMAFETGRSGIPCNALAISAKYGSPDAFLQMLRGIGIDEVTSVHVSANDAMLELVATESSKEIYFDLLERLLSEALAHAVSLHASGLVVSPSPEMGWVDRYFSEDLEAFEKKTEDALEQLVRNGREKGITVAVRNEFWSYFRGDKLHALLKQIPELSFTLDLAHSVIAGDDVEEWLTRYQGRIAYLHMTDTSFRDEAGNDKRINAELPASGSQKVFSDCGEGDVDLIGILQHLQKSGYDGWIICENRRTLDVYRGLLKLGWFVSQRLKKSLV